MFNIENVKLKVTVQRTHTPCISNTCSLRDKEVSCTELVRKQLKTFMFQTD